MKAANRSRDDCAKALGVHRTTLHRWLTGAQPTIDQAVRISKVTKIPVRAWAKHEAPK